MNDIVIVALITLLGTVISGVIGVFSAQRVTNVKIEELTKKVETHNKCVDRTYSLETRMALVEADIQEIKQDANK